MGVDIGQLRELCVFDRERIELGKARQAAVWTGKRPDKWPIIFGDRLTPVQEAIPNPNIGEAFYDAGMMLCQQLRGCFSLVNSGSDGVPSIRANLGTGTILSCLGLEQDVFPDQMPWLRQHLSVEQASRLTPDDIKFQGTFARGLEYIKYFREAIGESVPVYCLDTQGPFDLAHMLIGDEIFYLIYDDPKLLHQIMELCLELYVRCTEAVKLAASEPESSMFHSNSLYFPNAGVRICEDTTTLIGAEAIAEFAVPYTRRAAARFGGAWIHFCGRCDTLADQLSASPEIVAINYGVIPGKEADFDFDLEIDRLAAAGKVYHGGIPRKPGEDGEEYLRRLRRYCERGCLIPSGNPAVGGDKGFPSVAAVRDFWQEIA